MNILLINPPGTVTFVNPPLGILYIAAILKKENHNISIIDYNLENLNYQKLFDFINEKEIKAIGISIVTPKVYSAMDMAAAIRKNFPEIFIIAGGPHATLMPEQLMNECPAINYVIQGEGEFRMRDLIRNLEKKLPVNEIDGLAFKKDGKIINNPPQNSIEDINILPMPSRELIDINKYSSYMKTILSPATTMITSRGCPYKCIYCSKPITGKKIRSLNPENVVNEIQFLVDNYKIREIIFYDDSFTFNQERVLEICNLIIQKGIKIKWHCETRVNLINENLLKKMKEAGCYLIGYGIESGSNRLLKILQKGITIEQIENAVSITKKAGIKVLGYFMFGIPGETEEDIKQTIKLSKKLGVDFAQFSIATAYPGTELFEIAKSQNKVSADWSKSIYALGSKPIISISDIPVEKLYSYMKKAYFSFYFRPLYIFNKIKNIKTLNDFLYYFRGLKTMLKV
ncbi:MAG: radical SAM protein [Bacteroidales bacterium]|jgi:radical SAM superfamily enzyme YgiQ (UPF0313 family)